MADTYSLSERVAEEIRAVLARRRKSGRSLADDLGVSQTWMSTRLNGTTPIDLNDLERIAIALDVDVADLVLPTRREGRFITAVGSDKESQVPVKSHKPHGPERSPLTSYPHTTAVGLSTRRPGRILQGASA